jgi:hypothetical protein
VEYIYVNIIESTRKNNSNSTLFILDMRRILVYGEFIEVGGEEKMVGNKIRAMLVEEMETSKEFTRKNFGLAVGGDFREIVEEIVRDKKINASILCGFLMTAMSAKSVGEFMARNSLKGDSTSDSISEAILANLEAFKPQFEFLYWGIKIGRKLALQEVEMFKNIEG